MITNKLNYESDTNVIRAQVDDKSYKDALMIRIFRIDFVVAIFLSLIFNNLILRLSS